MNNELNPNEVFLPYVPLKTKEKVGALVRDTFL